MCTGEKGDSGPEYVNVESLDEEEEEEEEEEGEDAEDDGGQEEGNVRMYVNISSTTFLV